jgi:hypothetical protein
MDRRAAMDRRRVVAIASAAPRSAEGWDAESPTERGARAPRFFWICAGYFSVPIGHGERTSAAPGAVTDARQRGRALRAVPGALEVAVAIDRGISDVASEGGRRGAAR